MIEKEVLSVAGIAEYLGISESMVRQLIRERKIPFSKIERRYLFFLPVVRNWLINKTVQPENEINVTRDTTNHIWNKLQGDT